ncbi:MAG: PaaI family thioesterase [Pseudomonadota bacterium]
MTGFRIRNPDYEAEARASFAAQAMMTELGVEIEALAPGAITLSMPFNTRFTQQHGFLHGAVPSSVLDTACGFAAYTLMPPGSGVLTVEYKVSMLAPAKGERFRFEGRVVKPGRTLIFTEGEAFAIAEGVEKRISTLTATMMVVTDREDVKG